MGLGITVQNLSPDCLAAANRLLRANGLPDFSQASADPQFLTHAPANISYSRFSLILSFYERHGSKPWPASHLLHRGDSAGFFVPVDFQPVIVDASGQLAGDKLGSSLRLLDELREIAAPLDIDLGDNPSIDQLARSVHRVVPQPLPFEDERRLWFYLYEAAVLSIEHRTAIVFC